MEYARSGYFVWPYLLNISLEPTVEEHFSVRIGCLQDSRLWSLEKYR